MLRKTVFLAGLISMYHLPLQASNNIFLRGMNEHFFSASYMVEDGGKALNRVRELAIEDVEHPIMGKRCNAQEIPKFLDMVVKSNHYGPRYGCRTFNVDVYYRCS